MFSDLVSGQQLLSRDGRIFIFLYYDDDGNLCCSFGPGEDQISFWSSDGKAELDDPSFVSDADIVSFYSLF